MRHSLIIPSFLVVLTLAALLPSTTLAASGQERSEAQALVKEVVQMQTNLHDRLAITEQARLEALTWTSKVASTMYPKDALLKDGSQIVLRVMAAADDLGKRIDNLRALRFATASAQVYRDQAADILAAKKAAAEQLAMKVNTVCYYLPKVQSAYYPKQTPEARAAAEKLSTSLDQLNTLVRELRLKYQLTDRDLGVTEVARR